jgi:hypothetical protein
VYSVGDTDVPTLDDEKAITVVCCALGPIHPQSPAPSTDAERVIADHQTMATLVRQRADVPLRLVFISSVLALCPSRGREYYAGWKNVLAGLVQALSAERDAIEVSVFYPGRLVDRKSVTQPKSLLHTSYAELAERVVAQVQESGPQERVIGLDARLWLTLRSGLLVWSALSGRR